MFQIEIFTKRILPQLHDNPPLKLRGPGVEAQSSRVEFFCTRLKGWSKGFVVHTTPSTVVRTLRVFTPYESRKMD